VACKKKKKRRDPGIRKEKSWPEVVQFGETIADGWRK